MRAFGRAAAGVVEVAAALCAGDADLLLMAAGVGARMGLDVRKQWLPVCGRPLFVFTLERFRRFGFDSAIVVAHPDEAEAVGRELADRGLADVRVARGGRTRQESVRRGLAAAAREYVAVHDAARPFVSEEDAAGVLAEARRTGAATVGHPARDTLKRAGAGALVRETVLREDIWQVQTPQVFRRDWLLAAHAAAEAGGFAGTDDAALVEWSGRPVRIVAGSVWNLKLTGGEDLQFLRMWEAFFCGSD